MRIRVGVFIVSALAVWVASGHVARSADAPPPDFDVQDRILLHLDWGFVGRPVTLDLFGNRVRVSWDAGDLKAPTILLVELERTASSTVNGATLGADAVRLTWADPDNLAERGVRVEIPGDCAPDAMTDCVAYREVGSSWTKLAENRAAGYARVRIAATRSAYMRSGAASWYAYKNCRCAASPDFPKGTRVRVTSQLTGKFTVVRINDWGPERDKFPDRAIDLDAVAFKELAPLGAGIVRVTVEPIGPDDPDYAIADSMPLPSNGTVASSAIAAAPPKLTAPVSATVVKSHWSY